MGDANEKYKEESTDSSDNENVPDGGWGWVVVFACLTINIIYDGCSYSFGILFVNLLDYFGDTKSNTALIGSLFFSVPLLCGPLASITAERYGYRKSTMIGGVIAAGGFALGSMANSTWMLCLCYGLISGFGMSIPYFTASVAVAKYFKRRLALAVGIAECGAGVGTVVFAPITEYLTSTYGWRGALLILSGLVGNIVVCGALIRPVKRKKLHLDSSRGTCESPTSVHGENQPMLSENHVKVNSAQENVTPDLNMSMPSLSCHSFNQDRENYDTDCVREIGPLNNYHNIRRSRSLVSRSKLEQNDEHRSLPAMKTYSNTDTKSSNESLHHSIKDKLIRPCQNIAPLLCVPFLAFTMSNFIMYFWYDVPYVFTVDRAISLGIDSKAATFLVSLIGIVHTLANILYGYLGDKECINTSLLYGFSLIMCGVSMIVVPLCFHYVSLAITSAIFGLFSAATEALCAPMIVEIVGVKYLDQGFGLVMFLEGIANLAGPPIAGLLFDITGKFDATFYVSGAIVIAGGSVYTLYRLYKIAVTR